jgi:hypothetical protein
MKNKFCLVAVLCFLFPAASVLAATTKATVPKATTTTATFIAEGNVALAAGNWTQASVDFLAAGNQSPTNPQAQTLAAITELLAVEQSPAFETLVSRMGYDLDNSSMPPTLTPDPDGPASNANADEVQTAAVSTLLPLVQDADTRLAAAITNLASSPDGMVDLTANETGTLAVSLDKGDLLLLRVFAQAYICVGSLGKAFNTNVLINDLVNLQKAGNLDFEHVRQLYPQLFGRPASSVQAADLATAKTAFTQIATFYNSAVLIILPGRGERADQNPLFYVDPKDPVSVKKANTLAISMGLAEQALTGPVILPTSDDFLYKYGEMEITLAPIFTAADDPVQLFPATLNNYPVLSTLPDPTLGGILLSGTTDFWQLVTLQNQQAAAPTLFVDPYSLFNNYGLSPGQAFPNNTTITAGQNDLVIYLSVQGSQPYTVTWYKNGVLYDPTMDDTVYYQQQGGQLTLDKPANNLTTADSGNYSVKVTNRFGSVQESANVTVLPSTGQPIITYQPSDTNFSTDDEGDYVFVFEIDAVGTSAPSFNWTFNGSSTLPDDVSFSNYTNTYAGNRIRTVSYMYCTNLSTADVGTYQATVTNSEGSPDPITSNTANLTISDNSGKGGNGGGGGETDLPVIQWLSPNVSTFNLPVGSSTQLSVSVTSDLFTTVQWFQDGVAITDPEQAYPGQNFFTYSIGPASSFDAGVYTVVASNSAGNVSANVTMTVPVAPVISTQPLSQSVSANSTAKLSAASNAPAGAFYVWTLNNVVLTNGGNYTGVNTANLTITGHGSNLSGNYRLLIVTANGTVSSNSAVVTLPLVAPTIIAQPAPVTAVAGVGASATFTVLISPSSSTPLTYQWTFGGKNIAGATSSQLVVANVTTASAGKYAVVVKNSKGSVTSTAVALTVLIEPGFVTNLPATATVKAGKTVTFTVKANGTTPFNYQWQKNGVNLANGGQFSGVTTVSLKVTGVTSANNGSTFRVNVFNSATALLGNVPVSSAVVTLTVD